MSISERGNALLPALGFIFIASGILTIVAYSSGELVVEERVAEMDFEKEKFSEPHATFELESSQLVELTIDAVTLNDSWIWAKAVIADEKDRPVADYTFDLSYYSGSGWSEGSREDSRTFSLPAGSYKVIVYGEDPKNSRGAWTRESREEIDIRVEKGVMLARYGVLGLILSGGLLVLFSMFGSGSAEVEASGEWDFDDSEDDAFGDDGFGDDGFGEDDGGFGHGGGIDEDEGIEFDGFDEGGGEEDFGVEDDFGDEGGMDFEGFGDEEDEEF
jgi:hypothetical protein